MPYLHNYRLFISHAWKYSEGYNRAIDFLDKAGNFAWTNYSVPEHKGFQDLNSNQLGEQMKAQIRPVQCVIILAGMYAHHSGWIQYEIDFAKSVNKPILAIVPWGQERTPLSVQAAATKIVNWNAISIVSGIREITP